jgi:hypothetical protein
VDELVDGIFPSSLGGVVTHKQRFGVSDHPVRSIKGCFAPFS